MNQVASEVTATAKTAAGGVTPNDHNPLTAKERLIAGALGGFAPVVLKITSVDGRTLFSHFDWHIALGYGFQYLLLSLLGAGIAWAHKTETDLFKAIQLGIVAPALLTTIINGSKVPGNPDLPTTPSSVPTQYQPPQEAPTQPGANSNALNSGHYTAALDSIIQSVEAAPLQVLPVLQFTQIAPQSGASKFWQGFTSQDNNYYLVIGVYATPAQAQVVANQINSDPRLPYGFNVFYFTNSPFGGPGYSLIVGPGLNPAQAQAYVAAAAQVGLGPYVAGRM